MDNRKRKMPGFEGRMPAMAPLANPYVPFQLESPPCYDARKGLIRGTMFPGLDLPFHGMVNTNEKPVNLKTELQSLAFAMQDLVLYLDTHRCDQEALELYRSYQEQYWKCKEAYIKKCGPLTNQDLTDGDYAWLDDPWPWEYAANREG